MWLAQYPESPLMAVVVALKEALNWIKEWGIRYTVMEINALSLVQSLKTAVIGNSPLGLVLDDCRSLIKEIVEV